MNISDIARLAGVSSAAVSRYLNNGYLSEQKSEAIRKVIEETGYTPSKQAQMLRTKKTNLIGIILPKIDSESISRMVSGISSVVSAAGYEILFANTENDDEKELGYLNIFKNNRVDGIILIATVLTKKHRDLLKTITVPVVILGQKSEQTPCIFHDDYHAAYDLATEFMKGGCKKIAAISVNKKDVAVGVNRLQGLLDAALDAKVSIDPERIKIGPFSMDSGYENAKLIMEKYPDTDAIFCATDSIAVGALKYLRDAGIAVPDQVSIAGFGYSRMSRIVTPSLSTVHFYYKTCGQKGADLLLSLLESKDVPVKAIQLNYEIIKQESIRSK